MTLTLANQAQKKARAGKMLKRALAMRDELWPDVTEDFFWDRTKASGFSTIPRTLAYV